MVAACASSEPPTEQVLVTVRGEPKVTEQLVRLEALVYAADARTEHQPLTRHLFEVTAQREPGAEKVSLPFSFGIGRDVSEPFKLVVHGYASFDARAAPVLEHKVLAALVPGQTVAIDLLLSDACMDLSSPCDELDRTCLPEASACATVPQATPRNVVPGRELDGLPGLGTPPAIPPDGACPPDNLCISPHFPCVASKPSGYSCLGQYAEWPMSRAQPESRAERRFDTSTEGVARDVVTGLAWERAMSETYTGCSQRTPTNGLPFCTLDEAKLYCSGLTLGGRRWRLPAKVELESIYDETLADAALDRNVFTDGCLAYYWSATPNVRTLGTSAVTFWVGFAPMAGIAFQDPSRPACVRCVSGVASTAGTPAERYVVESDGAIRDTRTKLVWQPTYGGPALTVAAAKAYCSSLGSSYRVPGLKELLTIVDPTRTLPAIDPVFANTPNALFWTAATRADQTEGTWWVDSGSGFAFAEEQLRAEPSVPVGSTYVRCVRDG